MFTFALFIGIYSYLIFFLGILGLLTKINIWLISCIWLAALLFTKQKSLGTLGNSLKPIHFSVLNTNLKPSSEKLGLCVLFILIFLQALINLVGVLGPELAFDALWYHLTLPKLYLLHHAVYHVPGGLLYYSDMPKLGEMLYIGVLSFGDEIAAKALHFVFGLLVSFSLYKFARKFFNEYISLLIVVIFYSNLVVDWESITAYIDLIRTFFELLALWGIVNWHESKKYTWLVVSGVMIGFAITTKALAIGSFLVMLAVIIGISFIKRKKIKESLFGCLLFILSAIVVPLPWFIFSFIHTGNPVFPFFTKTYEVSASSPNPFKLFSDLWYLFIHSSDPISPLYLIFLPLLVVSYSKLKSEIKIVVWYCGLSLLLWYFTPRTGGGRFILPYLPTFSFVCGVIYSEFLKKTGNEWKYLTRILFFTIIFVALISIGYRGLANKKYLPVILGLESKKEFLSRNLNFGFGDFYDTDGYFATHIKPYDKVLLYGFHNLYYIDFPFIDNTWVKKGDSFDYIATQNGKIPPKFGNWQLVYSNDKTMVKLFKPSRGECQKICVY